MRAPSGVTLLFLFLAQGIQGSLAEAPGNSRHSLSRSSRSTDSVSHTRTTTLVIPPTHTHSTHTSGKKTTTPHHPPPVRTTTRGNKPSGKPTTKPTTESTGSSHHEHTSKTKSKEHSTTKGNGQPPASHTTNSKHHTDNSSSPPKHTTQTHHSKDTTTDSSKPPKTRTGSTTPAPSAWTSLIAQSTASSVPWPSDLTITTPTKSTPAAVTGTAATSNAAVTLAPFLGAVWSHRNDIDDKESRKQFKKKLDEGKEKLDNFEKNLKDKSSKDPGCSDDDDAVDSLISTGSKIASGAIKGDKGFLDSLVKCASQVSGTISGKLNKPDLPDPVKINIKNKLKDLGTIGNLLNKLKTTPPGGGGGGDGEGDDDPKSTETDSETSQTSTDSTSTGSTSTGSCSLEVKTSTTVSTTAAPASDIEGFSSFMASLSHAHKTALASHSGGGGDQGDSLPSSISIPPAAGPGPGPTSHPSPRPTSHKPPKPTKESTTKEKTTKTEPTTTKETSTSETSTTSTALPSAASPKDKPDHHIVMGWNTDGPKWVVFGAELNYWIKDTLLDWCNDREQLGKMPSSDKISEDDVPYPPDLDFSKSPDKKLADYGCTYQGASDEPGVLECKDMKPVKCSNNFESSSGDLQKCKGYSVQPKVVCEWNTDEFKKD